MNINRQINRLKQEMRLKEIADDGYFISREYQQDREALYELKQLQKIHRPCRKDKQSHIIGVTTP